jgi:hypothetical protein
MSWEANGEQQALTTPSNPKCVQDILTAPATFSRLARPLLCAYRRSFSQRAAIGDDPPSSL